MTEPQTFEDRFPLHQKIKDRRVEHEALLDFFDWAQNNAVLSVTDAEVSQIFADYFGIDLKAFDAEKEDMLAMIRDSSLATGVAEI